VKKRQGAEGVSEGWSPATVVSEDAPVLEPRQGVFDPCATLPVLPVALVAEDPVSPKDGGDEFLKPSVAAVGEDASVLAAEGLNSRSPIMDPVVSISRTAA